MDWVLIVWIKMMDKMMMSVYIVATGDWMIMGLVNG
jgi:hypothetical protein